MSKHDEQEILCNIAQICLAAGRIGDVSLHGADDIAMLEEWAHELEKAWIDGAHSGRAAYEKLVEEFTKVKLVEHRMEVS